MYVPFGIRRFGLISKHQLVEKVNTPLSSFSPEAKSFFIGGVRERTTETKRSYFNGWQNSFLPPVSSAAAAAATSFIRLLSKKPGESGFRKPSPKRG
jgi:hypothetical protein